MFMHYIQGEARNQDSLFPASAPDDHLVRVIEAYVPNKFALRVITLGKALIGPLLASHG
jgi:hypothetical protein